MVDIMEEQEMQQKYMELQMLDAQIKQIEQQMTTIEQQIAEIIMIQQAVEALPNTKKGTDLFVPISQGIFIKAKVEDTDSLLINVGSNVAVKKTLPEAKEMLDEQTEQIKKLKVKFTADMENYLHKARMIEKEIVGSKNV